MTNGIKTSTTSPQPISVETLVFYRSSKMNLGLLFFQLPSDIKISKENPYTPFIDQRVQKAPDTYHDRGPFPFNQVISIGNDTVCKAL